MGSSRLDWEQRAPALDASPRLAIVVPCYDDAALLEGAVAAIATQTLAPDEVVIVDDGSQPAAAAAIAALAERHSFVRLLRHEANRGVNAACATGLAAVRADYVLFAAADDRLAPEVVERVRAALADHRGCGILFSDNALMDAAGTRKTLFPLGLDAVRAFSGPEFQRFLRRGFFYVATPTVWYRTEALGALGGFDERLRWHADFFAAYAAGMWRGAVYVPGAVSYFRVSDGSYSAARRDARAQIEALRAWLAKTAEESPWPQRRAFRRCALLPDYDWRAAAALCADPGYLTPRLLLRLLARGAYGVVRPALPFAWRRLLRRRSSRKATR